MSKFIKSPKRLVYKILLFILALSMVACSNNASSIYKGIDLEGDGVIAVDIPDDGEPPLEDTKPDFIDELSKVESGLIDDLHNGEKGKISFLVVNGETNRVIKSYQARQPRRLASISKLSTSLAALEEVNNVSVSKISRMLKTSNNGEASRYVRLAAKAIAGVTISTPGYTQGASCPAAAYQEDAAAKVVLKWVHEKIPVIDWTGSNLSDGAGCDYDNQYSALQTVWLLDLADSMGKAYGGKSFEELLSISGTDGTWGGRNREHKGMIFAKTGTLTPTSNLAGYFYAKRDKVFHKYYFVIFVEKRGGGSHTTRARKMIESLVRHWINQLNIEEGPSLGSL